MTLEKLDDDQWCQSINQNGPSEVTSMALVPNKLMQSIVPWTEKSKFLLYIGNKSPRIGCWNLQQQKVELIAPLNPNYSGKIVPIEEQKNSKYENHIFEFSNQTEDRGYPWRSCILEGQLPHFLYWPL